MLSKNHKEIEMMERVCIVGFDTYHTALEGILFTYVLPLSMIPKKALIINSSIDTRLLIYII